jgi:uncharacterized phage-associated protein
MYIVTYRAIPVANYIISEIEVTPLALIKLVYLSHAWSLAILGHSLIEEDVVAWKYGPNIEELYRTLPKEGVVTSPLSKSYPEFTSSAKRIVTQVIDKYGKLEPRKLSAFCNKEGSPWDIIWNVYERPAIIPKSLIREYYEGLL